MFACGPLVPKHAQTVASLDVPILIIFLICFAQCEKVGGWIALCPGGAVKWSSVDLLQFLRNRKPYVPNILEP